MNRVFLLARLAIVKYANWHNKTVLKQLEDELIESKLLVQKLTSLLNDKQNTLQVEIEELKEQVEIFRYIAGVENEVKKESEKEARKARLFELKTKRDAILKIREAEKDLITESFKLRIIR